MKTFTRLFAATALAAACLPAAAQTAPSWVPPTPLTAAEMTVSRGYQAVFGRVPEKEGLLFWAGHPMSSSISTAVDTLATFAPGIANYDFVKQFYSHVLGRSLADDAGGIRFWACQLPWDGSQVEAEGYPTFCTTFGSKTKGELVQEITGHLEPSTDPVYHQRKAFMEYAGRVQKVAPGSYSGVMREAFTSEATSVLTAQTLLRRVSSSVESFNEAMNDLNRLTNKNGSSNPSNSFDIGWNASTLWEQAADFSGAGVKVNRHIVWYNRNRQMMVGQVYLPSTFPSTSDHQAVVALHSGGWKEGMPDNIGKLSHEFASAGYVVLSPGYRLTPSFSSPAQQEDVADFVALVRSKTSRFKIASSKVHLFGYSAGGHLAALLGTSGNYGCVATYAAPLDLTKTDFPAVMLAAIDAYAGTTSKSELSPQANLARGTNTRFMVMHGTMDGLVPMNQATSFQVAAPNRVQLQAFNAGHLISDANVPLIRYHAMSLFQTC